MQNNSFIENIAIEGGAIQWIESLPSLLEMNQYQSNNAIYGPNIAAFPLKISLTVIDTEQNVYISDNLTRILNLTEIQSGGALLYNLNFKLLDYYNQTIFSLSVEYKSFYYHI